MRRTIELSDTDMRSDSMLYAVLRHSLQNIRFVLQDRGLVRVNVEIVGSGEDGHDGRETGRLCLSIHAISVESISFYTST